MCPMIIGEIGLQVALETALIENDQVIQALPPGATDYAFYILSLPGEPLDCYRFHLVDELMAEDAAVIT